MATDGELRAAALAFWRPPPKLSLSQWADQHAYLSAESAAEAGKWRTLPYQRGIMDAFTDPTIDTVVWMKSARVGATKIFNHLIGYHIHQDPCPIMVCQPTVEDAEGYSKDEIAPMIRDTPALRPLVSDPKAKDGSNTILAKTYPGGTLGMVGANSARGFRRVSRRVVLFDEVDGYPASTPEGDQIKLGIKRSEYYWNRKIGIASTPTTKGFSRIERWFERTDQRRYFVPCPECGTHQVLRWGQMKWEPDRPETAAYECENCAALIPHSRKRWMVERGEWRATAQADAPGMVGFHLWAAYSFSPNATWEQLVREFLEVKGDRDQLRTFVNTALGETFEDLDASSQTPEALAARREDYEPGACPEGVLLLTCGVDVQGGGGSLGERLAVSVWGWGRGEESWLVWHQEIHGDPTRPEVWAQLDSVLEASWQRADGVELKITQTAVDSGGHATAEVYAYARERRAQGVVAIKGSSVRGAVPVGKGKPVDVNARGKVQKRGVTLYMVGTDTIKTTLMARLRHNAPGPGFLHFGLAADDDFFRQLTAERVQVRSLRGFPVRQWVKKPGDRNEALDTLVYSYAALQLVARRYNRQRFWEQLEAQLLGRQQGPAPSAAEPERPRRRPRPAGPSFVNGW
jgi:phage terminase large subunit GpA-like protein